MKILVIDSDLQGARRLAHLLADHDVCMEKDAAEGLARALRAAWDGAPFDAVICERAPYGLRAQDVFAALRAHAEPPSCVVLCERDQVADVPEEHLLVKPVSRGQLKAVLGRVYADRRHAVTRRIRVTTQPQQGEAA